jgi:RNA polymerase sigma-70 factor (ECF subfamily)
LNKILEKLTADNRKLLELSYFLGYTQEEIAGLLNIPLGTVKTRLRTIILQLRKLMELNKK